MSVCQLMVPHIQMQKYDSNWTSPMNWFDVAGIASLVHQPESVNTFESIEAIHTATFQEEPLGAYFWQ